MQGTREGDNPSGLSITATDFTVYVQDKYFSVYVHIQKQNKQHNQPHIYICIYRFYCLSVRNDLALRTFFWILIFSLINILENSSSK